MLDTAGIQAADDVDFAVARIVRHVWPEAEVWHGGHRGPRIGCHVVAIGGIKRSSTIGASKDIDGVIDGRIGRVRVV